MKPKILVICGPTATGKSALAVRLAKKFNGEVISADSRQVYKGLDIGTGKITQKEMGGVPHHLLDVASPKNQFTVEQYKNSAQKTITGILKRGKLPIICGGTGFYIQAVVDNISFPEVSADPKLRAKLEKRSTEELLKMLKKLDQRRARDIDPKNSRRLIRAIEIAIALGKVPKIKINSLYNSLSIGIDLPDKELKQKILIRLLSRMKQGMLREATTLHKAGLSWRRMNELGLEYRSLALLLQKKMNRKEFEEKLNTEIWHYSKRQRTWFHRNKKIKWFKPTDYKKIESKIKTFLK